MKKSISSKLCQGVTATATLLLSLHVQASAQTKLENTFSDQGLGAHYSNMVAVDLDNDGYRDLIVAGIGNHVTNYAGAQTDDRNRLTEALMFDFASGTWTRASQSTPCRSIGFNSALRPSLTAVDFNRDGIMDIITFESPGVSFDNEPFIDHISDEGIFLGNGDGTFTKFNPTIVDSHGNEIDFDMRKVLSATAADFTNDGLIDIVAIGYHADASNAPLTFESTAVLLKNLGGGKMQLSSYFTDDYASANTPNGKAYQLNVGQVKEYDFNNDGYMDFIIVANSDNRTTLGLANGASSHFTDIFLNDPACPGQFHRQYITDSGFPLISEGGVTIADFNADGIPDLFASGWTGRNRGSYKYGVYLGAIDADGKLRYEPCGNEELADMRNQNSVNSQYLAFDWDGDGIIDIFNHGRSKRDNTQTCFLSRGLGNGTFEEALRLGGGSEGSVTVVDWDGDGTPDYVNTSQSSDKEMHSGISTITNIFSVTRNPNPLPVNDKTPVALRVEQSKGRVVATWEGNPQAPANQTFEYYVSNSRGEIVAGGNSFTEGKLAGVRKVNAHGNACQAKKAILHLPDGEYTFGVQSIDASFAGSPFATAVISVKQSEYAPTEAIKIPDSEIRKGEKFTNPVIGRSVPDPTVIRHDDGTFFLYGTEDVRNVPIYQSADLVNWEFVGTAFTNETRPTMVPNGGIWAPDINKIGNKYVLYFSKSEWGKEWECGIGCAVADSPAGPFRDAKKLFISNEIGVQNSIDPFYIEEEDGSKYLFWGSFRGIYGIELSDDGLSIAEGAQPVQISSALTEATYIHKRGKYYYLFGSAGSCCNGASSTYHVVVNRSENLFGPYVSKTGWGAMAGETSNVMYRNDAIIAPGHNSEIITDSNGRDWMLFHGYEADDIAGSRKVFLDEVLWDEEAWPYMKGMQPSVEQFAPDFSGSVDVPTLRIDGRDGRDESGIDIEPISVGKIFRVAFSGKSSSGIAWDIYSVSGMRVLSGSDRGNETSIDISGLPTGMYIITVRTDQTARSAQLLRL